jgi:DNA mismatch repair protein MutL
MGMHLNVTEKPKRTTLKKGTGGRSIFLSSILPVGRGLAPADNNIFNNYSILGILFQTYWLVSQGESLYIIDQHAAHERVMYENILTTMNNNSIDSQPLLEPIKVRLTPGEMQIFKDNVDLFNRFGFITEIIGYEQIQIISVPYIFNGPVPPNFFMDILDKLEPSDANQNSIDEQKFKSVAMSACKAAVKAHDALNETEAKALIEELLTMENPFTCPHGRPTIIEISKREIERKFKRT